MYDRKVAGRTLNFEASGALKDASLVMRDRETDSWWSIMTSDAIGGALDGADLEELPYGEKATWGDWKRRHPETTVLSVDGVEHVFYRRPGLPMYASSDAFLIDETAVAGVSVDELIGHLRAGHIAGAERLNGFDTFWYSWVAVNENTELLD